MEEKKNQKKDKQKKKNKRRKKKKLLNGKKFLPQPKICHHFPGKNFVQQRVHSVTVHFLGCTNTKYDFLHEIVSNQRY